MKKRILRFGKALRAALFVLLMGVAGLTNAWAQSTFSEGNLNYSVNDDGTSVTVTGHTNGTSAVGALNIPESVTHLNNSYAVTKIASFAFEDCTGITSVTIPISMTYIGERAFEGCSGLLVLNYNATNCSIYYYYSSWYGTTYTWLNGCSSLVSLNIGENVEVIPNYFVYGLYTLVGALSIPNSVTSIGEYAFYNCDGFVSISFDNSITSIGAHAFEDCDGLVSLTIPNAVTTISSHAFASCGSLTSVTLPNELSSINEDAFSGCTSLTSVVIPNSVITVGESAFYGCTGLAAVEIGSSVLSLGTWAFSGCTSLTSVIIPNSVVSMGSSAFKGCSSLASINIPASVVSIGSEAFSGCTALGQITVASGNPNYDSRDNCNAIIQTASNKLVTGCKNTVIPNTVVTIGERAFSKCSGLVGTLTIPNSVTSIEAYAFSFCSGIVGALNLPESIVTIGNYAFENCTGITALTIPSTVTSIGNHAFGYCSSLLTLNYNATNCSLGNYNYTSSNDAYYHWLRNCNSLVSLSIGENVQVIPDYFLGCYDTYSGFSGTLTIPNSVTTIGNSAFYGCSGFTSAIIGDAVASIGNKAFYSCYNLASVSFGGALVSIGNEAFCNCDDLTSVIIPNSVTTIGNEAFKWCDELASVEIGSAVASIGSSAFSGCGNLANCLVHAQTPPTLGNSAFYNVPTNIPVYVPCGQESAYTSVNWGGFSNIIGVCGGEITVTANPAGAGSVTGGGSYEGGATCTLTAISYGYLPFLNWTKDGEVVSHNSTYSFIVTGDAAYVANFGGSNGGEVVIGEGTATNSYIPSYSYYNYTLSQQIYTAGEIGGSGTINSIAFFNDGAEKTRELDIYLVHTNKMAFSSNSDWITVTENDHVYSGSVTMMVGDWTVIDLDTPFQYDCTSNLALIVDDNTGNYSNSPHMACRVFDADGNQALYKYNDNTNYDPNDPSSISGTLLSVKNQIKLSIASAQGENIDFADDAVKSICVANWDTNGDGELSYDEAASVTDLGRVFEGNVGIVSFDELQYFTGLTSIGYCAFNACPSLTSVTFSNSITSIGDLAFYQCSALTSITIPNSIISIGDHAFYHCSALTSIVIPSSVTSLDGTAFLRCGLLQIVVDAGNTVFDSREDCNAIINTASNTLILGCKNTVIPGSVTSIGDYAFHGCHGLTSVVIPNSVISIGERAFHNINSSHVSITIGNSVSSIGNRAFEANYSHIDMLTILAETPPTLGEGVFDETSKSTPVHVPCGSIGTYSTAIGWSEFNNYHEDVSCGYEITATANPSEGGTVSGGGSFALGETCTLIAIANAGYTFTNWTKDGVVVSTETTYSLIVTEAASYVANFTEVSNENHWDYDINAYPGTMSVNAIIEIDGIEQLRTDLEVGAFCGDECRGTMRASDEFYYPDVMPHYYLFLTIHGDNGDQITFRIYDHSLNQELDLTCANTLTFVDNATIGDFDEPYAINFRNAITQTTNFRSGWNWWSSYVDMSDINGLAMLEEGLGSAGVQIKSQSKFVINYGTTWLGGLNAITNEQTLKVQVNAPVTVELTSKPVSPADYPLTLNAGWNWIGYPCTNSLSVANAFSNYTPSTGDQVKTQASYAIYRAGIGWIGALRTITPGDGLFFYTSTGGTLIFPEGTRDTELADNLTADNNHWVSDMNAYPSNMTVMAVVELEDIELQSERYELAAFANGEVRGSARLIYVEPLNRYMAFLTITGDEAANLTFGLYDTETGAECLESDDLLVFTADAMVGELESPMVVSFRGTTGLSDLERSLQVYPNPVNRGERFALTLPVGTKVQVEVVNALGVVVETLRATSIQAPASPGVYTLRITVDGKGTISRKLVVR